MNASPSSPSAPSRSALIIAFAAIYVIWGSTYLGIRVAIETMPPFIMAAGRFLIAGSVLMLWLRARGVPAPNARQWRTNTVIGILLLLGGNGLVVWAEQFVPSGITALIIGVQPLFFVLTEWAWTRGSRPTATMSVALLVGFAGVAWLAAPWQSAGHGGLNIPGVIAILFACIFWALGSIYSRYAKHGADPLMASAVQMLTGGAALLLAALVRSEFQVLHLDAISARSWGAFAYLVGVGSLIGFSTFVWLMKNATPARVSTYAYVNPIVAVFFGWAFASEVVTARMVIAALAILGAVAVIIRYGGNAARKSVAREAAPEPVPEPRRAGRSS